MWGIVFYLTTVLPTQMQQTGAWLCSVWPSFKRVREGRVHLSALFHFGRERKGATTSFFRQELLPLLIHSAVGDKLMSSSVSGYGPIGQPPS